MNPSIAAVLVPTLGVLAFGSIAGFALYQWLRVRRVGLAAALVGAEGAHELGEVDAHCGAMRWAYCRVLEFAQAGPERQIGIALRTGNRLSFNMTVAALSVDEARDLAALLRRGIGDNDGPKQQTPPRRAPRRPVRDGPI